MLTNKYKASVAGAAPLQIQLTATSIPIFVTGFYACGESGSGSASRPVLSRPSTPGTGSGTAIPLSVSAPAATATVITLFSTGPTLPVVNSGAFNLPMRVVWNAAPKQEFVLGLAGSGLLYADASAGHTWSGELCWEER